MPIIPTIHLNGSSKAELLDKLRTAIGLIDKAIDGVRQTAPNGRDYYPQGTAAFQEARDAFHLMLGKLGEVRGELYDIALGIIPQGRDAGEGGEGFEPVPVASVWRPMADAPTDGAFLAKFRGDLTIVVDGDPQRSHWAGRQIVARAKDGEIVLDAPVAVRWWFELGDFEGWMPLHGEGA
jgi:hypothetical protein